MRADSAPPALKQNPEAPPYYVLGLKIGHKKVTSTLTMTALPETSIDHQHGLILISTLHLDQRKFNPIGQEIRRVHFHPAS